MNAQELPDVITACRETDTPLLVLGPAGVGKSHVIREYCDERQLPLIDRRLSMLDPVDLSGVPVPNETRTMYLPPSWIPQDDGPGLLFLDELNLASPGTQAAAYQLIHDRRCGDAVLGRGWLPIAAGNREVDRCGTTTIKPALLNRFMVVELEVDAAAWQEWARAHDVSPEWRAYIQWRPERLHTWTPETPANTPFTTPRSFTAAATAWARFGTSPHIRDMVAGLIGRNEACEVFSFLALVESIGDVDALLADPDNAVVPNDPAVLYALLGALATKAKAGAPPDTVWRYATRLPVEYALLLSQDLAAICPAALECAPYRQWAVQYQHALQRTA